MEHAEELTKAVCGAFATNPTPGAALPWRAAAGNQKDVDRAGLNHTSLRNVERNAKTNNAAPYLMVWNWPLRNQIVTLQLTAEEKSIMGCGKAGIY